MNRPSLRPFRERRAAASLLLLLLLSVLVSGFMLPRAEATAWWDSDWSYRRELTLVYGSNLVNAEVLLNSTIPATAYSEGKMQSDCDDLRFVDDSNNALTFFTEVCNVTAGGHSLVWVTASVTAPNSTIWMYYGNSGAASASQSWSGYVVVMFTSLPSGWTRYTTMDGRIPRGSSTAETLGGSDSQTHTSTTPTVAAGATLSAASGGTAIASGSHTHTTSVSSVSTDTVLPPYIAYIFGYATFSYSLPSGSVVMMNGSIPASWAQDTMLSSKFPRGAASYGAIGGSTTHTHTVSTNALSVSSGTVNQGVGSAYARASHTHTGVSAVASASGTSLPDWFGVVYINNTQASPILSGMVVMFTVLPPLGWTRVTGLDDRMPYGQSSFGGTGSGAHTHAWSGTSGGPSATNGYATGSGVSVAHVSHTHTVSGTLNSVTNLPAYCTMIFGQRVASLPTITFGDEVGSIPYTVSFQVVGSGSGYSAPIFHYVQAGIATNYTLTTTPTAKACDSGSAWSVTPNPLSGSNASVRWYSTNTLSGTVAGPQTLVFTFYLQYVQTLSYSITGTGSGYSAPSYTANRNNVSTPQTLTTTPTGYWYDYQASWAVTNPLSGSNSSARWYCTGTVSGTIGGEETHACVYYLQYYLTMSVYPGGGGTTTPASSGWYNQGTDVILVAFPSAGYIWGAWIGTGTGSYSGVGNPYDHITMNAPIVEQADFTSATTMTVTTTSTSVSTTQTTATVTTTGTTITSVTTTNTQTSTYTNTTTMTQTNTFTSGGPPPPPPATVTLMMDSWFGVVNQSHSEVHELMISETGAVSVVITDVEFSESWIQLNDSLINTCGCYLIVGPGTPVPLHFIVAPGFDVPANKYYPISVYLEGRASTGQQLTYQSLGIGVTVYSPYATSGPVSIPQPVVTPEQIAGAALIAVITGTIGYVFRRASPNQ